MVNSDSTVAAVDCGTNSIRLLIVSANPETGKRHELTRLMRIVRLGEGVDETHRFSEAALERTFSVTREYADICAANGVEKLRFVATSASRDAENAEVFRTGIYEILGIFPEVIPGTEEAQLSFVGATSGHSFIEPTLVVDIGGGSTEFVAGTGTSMDAAISTDMGSVRLKERFFADRPQVLPGQFVPGHAATDDLDPALLAVEDPQLFAAVKYVDGLIEQAHKVVDLAHIRHFIGVAGTVTTITAWALGLGEYRPVMIDGAVFDIAAALEACRFMMQNPPQVLARLGYMPDGREDVIGAGALVWDRVLRRVADVSGVTEVVTSERDILDGIISSLLNKPCPGTPLLSVV